MLEAYIPPILPEDLYKEIEVGASSFSSSDWPNSVFGLPKKPKQFGSVEGLSDSSELRNPILLNHLLNYSCTTSPSPVNRLLGNKGVFQRLLCHWSSPVSRKDTVGYRSNPLRFQTWSSLFLSFFASPLQLSARNKFLASSNRCLTSSNKDASRNSRSTCASVLRTPRVCAPNEHSSVRTLRS